ncbi:MAG: hypothetical protein IE933_14435 [Sphingomonadales bacterium]|nr:hypothetical protein [Sphingomonadales bacterium]MBD3772420.1 hypothetical protein [Paracoccaceae bacterium]
MLEQEHPSGSGLEVDSSAAGGMRMSLTREPEKVMPTGDELALVRTAFSRSPTLANRKRLVRMLLLDDQQDQVRSLLDEAADRSFADEVALAAAWLAAEHEHGDKLAVAAAGRALSLAQDDQARSEALALSGKAMARLGDRKGARAALEAALALDPANKDACKRLAAIELSEGRGDALLQLTDRLGGLGAAHARLFGARVLAHARLGNLAEAKREAGDPHFHSARELPPPPGWDDIGAFNDALAAELLTHPAMRNDRYGSASNFTQRVEAPSRPDRPAVRALVGQILATIHERIAELDPADSDWFDACPERAFLRTWCVITDSDGFEGWHVHQFGWLSGVYYVRVPESISRGNSNAGCLAFGLPEDLAGREGAKRYGEKLVRPQEGLMVTFPSHAYHRTYPHETGEKRICFAFDVRPLD